MATDTRDINYAAKYAKRLDQLFTQESKTIKHMKARGEYKEDEGVASVYFRTVDTSDFLQPHTGPQFGTADVVNSGVVRKDVKYFYEISKVLANVDLYDTAGALSEAGMIMQQGIKEQYAPLIDKIALGEAILAATGYGGDNVVAYDATDVLTNIDDAVSALAQQLSTPENQTIILPWSVKAALDKNLFTSFAPEKNDTVIENGKIVRLVGAAVEFLPDVYFCTLADNGDAPYATATLTPDPTIKGVVWDDRCMGYVNKLKDINVLTGQLARAAGYDGAVLRGLFRPGAWVFDANGTKKGIAIIKAAA